jgi:hypothetical protein
MGSGEDPYLGDLIAVARVPGFQTIKSEKHIFWLALSTLQVMLCRIWKRL